MNKKDNKRDYKSMAILAIILIVTVILLVLIFKALFGGKAATTSNTEVNKIINNKETAIIYVENSDSSKCSKCSTIKKHLDDSNINYSVYDVNKVKDSTYKEFLKKLYIDSEIFNYPAVIYIKDGAMYSNIINIEKTSTVDQFIRDYDLTKIK